MGGQVHGRFWGNDVWCCDKMGGLVLIKKRELQK